MLKFDILFAALDFLTKAAIPVLAVLAGVHFALNRFIREALWNKKYDAYIKILEHLHYSRKEAEDRLDLVLREQSGESPPKYTPEAKAHIAEMEKVKFKAKDEVDKILDFGALVISREAITYLETALKPRFDDWKNDSDFDFWTTEEENMRKAIERINAIARSDLGVETQNTKDQTTMRPAPYVWKFENK